MNPNVFYEFIAWHNFFDSKKHLVDIIPEVLLRLEANLDKDVQPRERKPLAEAEAK
ncbi:hypothetical protein MASR2M29_13900 [Spirochaetota bacterium]